VMSARRERAWCFFWGVQGDEATRVAKLASSRWSAGSAIARRSVGRRTGRSAWDQSRLGLQRKTRKERRGGCEGGGYRGGGVMGRLGFAQLVRIDGQGRRRALPGLLPELGGDPDRWGPPVSGRGREGKYPFGFCPGMARGPFPGSGRIWSRGLFFCSFVFLFSDFLFISHLLQQSFKSTQTKS
jgi:hypothetical protein